METPDINMYTLNGKFYGILSIFFGFFTFASNNADLIIKVIVACGSFVTAIVASRYYLLASKERKQQMEINKMRLEQDRKHYAATQSK